MTIILGEVLCGLRYMFNRKTFEPSPDSEVHFHPRMKLEQWKALNAYGTIGRSMRYNLIVSLQ